MCDVVSDDVARKIRSEALRRFDRDKNPYIDLLAMMRCEKYASFLQRVTYPQEAYIFSEEQVELLRINNKMLLKMSRNTLFLDATGGIVAKLNENSKRVFLYSLVLHIKDKKSKGIVIPIAEATLSRHYQLDITRFLLDFKQFCLCLGMKWPIWQRIVTDWSWALINSSILFLNSDTATMPLYLKKCYTFLKSKGKSLNFGIVQLCCCHFIKILIRDIEQFSENDDQCNFFKSALIMAVNISEYKQIWKWFSWFVVILLSTLESDIYLSAKKNIFYCNHLKNVSKEFDFDKSLKEEQSESSDEEQTTTDPKYKQSPFYKKSCRIVQNIKSRLNDSGKSKNILKNEKVLDTVLNKYMPYVPLWSNIMGVFVDSTDTRISNSPVESYFGITKQYTLKNKSNVRPSEYIRESKTYIDAKIKDVHSKFISKCNKPYFSKPTKYALAEESWKRTPKKKKEKININITHGEKILKQQHGNQIKFSDEKSPYEKKIEFSSNNMPVKIKNKTFVIGNYDHIYKYVYSKPTPFQTGSLHLHEFESLNADTWLFNNVVDIYIHIIIYMNEIKNIGACLCQEGRELLYGSKEINIHNIIDVKSINTFIIPILNAQHYTFVFINFSKKTINYIDPMPGKKYMTLIKTKIFKMLSNAFSPLENWGYEDIDHIYQTDSFNCGVLVCSFIEALLKNEPLTTVVSPNEYREIMKQNFLKYSVDMTDKCLHCEGGRNIPMNKCSKCGRSIDSGCLKEHYGRAAMGKPFTCYLCVYNT